jgi:hypothetical protein
MATTTIELQPPRHLSLSSEDDASGIERLDSPPPNAQPALQPVSKRRQAAVLLAAFSDVFLTIGINQAYGVFLAYYLTTGSSHVDPFLPRKEAENKAMLAFVGTLGAGLTWGGSIFVNPIMARTKDLRKVTAAGAVLIAGGYILASFCDRVRFLPFRTASPLTFPGLATASHTRPHIRCRQCPHVLPHPLYRPGVLRQPQG